MKSGFDWFFRDRRTGTITIAQFPNAALWIFIAVVVVRRVANPDGAIGIALDVIGTVAIGWWAVDEIVRGVNPWRRVLGAAVLSVVLVGLASALR